MIALAMVLLHVFDDRSPEMVHAEWYDPIEALLPDRPHETFGVGIRVWRVVRRAHDLDSGSRSCS